MKKLAVYIHIPFCVKKCAYCDFNSAAPHGSDIDDYIDALLNEIIIRSRLASGHEVSTVFIGGGTPSYIDASYIARILDTLRDSFEAVRPGSYNPVEVTIECNPGTVDIGKFISYKNAGINRVSLGLQSADEVELKLLGRIHTYEEWLSAVNMAGKAGFININTDLISGIPGQTTASFMDTLNKVIHTGIPHISVYSLIVEPGTELYGLYGPGTLSEDEQDIIDENDRLIYEATKKRLEIYGYKRYEISNYSKPGYECAHNIVYWRRGNYIGIGSGAASLIDNIRFANAPKLRQYISDYSECHVRYKEQEGSVTGYISGKEKQLERLDVYGQMSEYMILGLRMAGGISVKEFAECFGRSIYDVYGDVISSWISKGGLITEGDRIRCSEYGFNICNQIFYEFM